MIKLKIELTEELDIMVKDTDPFVYVSSITSENSEHAGNLRMPYSISDPRDALFAKFAYALEEKIKELVKTEMENAKTRILCLIYDQL